MVGANGQQGDPRDIVRVVHDIPGRQRLRLPVHARTTGLADDIRELAGVSSCTWSPETRGLLVLYRPDIVTSSALTQAVIQHARLGEGTIVEAPPALRLPTSEGQSIVAGAAADVFGELDRRVHGWTRGLIGLAGLVPLVLTVWAVRELVLGRTSALSWSSALWYAHGLFRDYTPFADGD